MQSKDNYIRLNKKRIVDSKEREGNKKKKE